MNPDSHELEIESGRHGPINAFLSLPRKDERLAPGVIVIHEIVGLNDDIRRISEHFSAEGYGALAPDLYSGSVPRPICIMKTLRSLAKGEGPALDALEACRAWLAARPEIDPSRIGVAGFCMGGGFALMFAVRAPVRVAATFYGDVPRRAEELAGSCPVVGGYGAKDHVFAPAGRRLDRMLGDLEVERDVVMYPDVGHSYMNQHGPVLRRLGAISPMRTGYDEHAAEDSWRRMLAFFARHLE
ncbi:MAG: dienelactone hydrolase family protein [bacterium]|nr:dienelactone hydrolase family protein [bacterium]